MSWPSMTIQAGVSVDHHWYWMSRHHQYVVVVVIVVVVGGCGDGGGGGSHRRPCRGVGRMLRGYSLPSILFVCRRVTLTNHHQAMHEASSIISKSELQHHWPSSIITDHHCPPRPHHHDIPIIHYYPIVLTCW